VKIFPFQDDSWPTSSLVLPFSISCHSVQYHAPSTSAFSRSTLIAAIRSPAMTRWWCGGGGRQKNNQQQQQQQGQIPKIRTITHLTFVDQAFNDENAPYWGIILFPIAYMGRYTMLNILV
jgi:hypothetical protein